MHATMLFSKPFMHCRHYVITERKPEKIQLCVTNTFYSLIINREPFQSYTNQLFYTFFLGEKKHTAQRKGRRMRRNRNNRMTFLRPQTSETFSGIPTWTSTQRKLTFIKLTLFMPKYKTGHLCWSFYRKRCWWNINTYVNCICPLYCVSYFLKM